MLRTGDPGKGRSATLGKFWDVGISIVLVDGDGKGAKPSEDARLALLTGSSSAGGIASCTTPELVCRMSIETWQAQFAV